jgi:hypothetical protein
MGMFAPRPDDIYVASYPHSGTSLVQMLVFHLLSDAGTTFGHVSEVMPLCRTPLREGGEIDHLPFARFKKASAQTGLALARSLRLRHSATVS